LKIDNSEIELSNFKEYSNIGEVLNKLIILSKSGNELLLELYNKINECFDNITSLISDKYLNLINIIHLIKLKSEYINFNFYFVYYNKIEVINF
jgi:hypothetical protein